jgi:DNA-binding response OmpR family regulator
MRRSNGYDLSLGILLQKRGEPRSRLSTGGKERKMSTGVLVIDDSATVRKILEVCLRRAGYEVISFSDGVEAIRWLATLEAFLPQLVFLDIEMPRMDGYAVAQYFKARPQYSHMVIVMLSARTGILDRLKGRLAGADEYVTKPFRTQTILTIVQAYLGDPPEPIDGLIAQEEAGKPIERNILTHGRWQSPFPVPTTCR